MSLIVPAQTQNPKVKPKWQLPVGVMEGIVAYNCRKSGFPRPVLAMPMWEGAGNRVIDYSGYGHHGVLTNAPEWREGGIKLDGTSSYISVSSLINDMDLTKPWTMFIKAKLASVTDYGPCIGFVHKDGNEYAYLGHDDNSSPNFKIGSDAKTPGNGSTLLYNTEYDMGLVWDGSKLIGYLNGIYDYDVTPNPAITWSELDLFMIGALYKTTVVGYVDGTFNTPLVFDSELTSTQIKFISDNPYFMYQIPEQLYGKAAAAAGVTIPIFMQHYRQLMRG